MANESTAQALSMALAHHQAGRLAEAERLYRELLARDPRSAEALYLLGTIAAQVGQLEPAEQLLLQALAIRGDFPEGLVNLGSVRVRQQRLDDAIESYKRAAQLFPRYVLAHNELGASLLRKGRLDEAIASHRRAIELAADDFDAQLGMGNALVQMGRHREARDYYEKAAQLRPASPQALNNLGFALHADGLLVEAIAQLQHVIAAEPNFAPAHHNLANALKDDGRIKAAVAEYERAIQLKPDYAEAHNSLVYAQLFDERSTPQSILAEHRQWAAQHADGSKYPVVAHANPRDPDRRLRIGYLSPDFCGHAVGRSLLVPFAHHDHQQFEIVCFSGTLREDAVTQQLKSHADEWHSTCGTSDDQLAYLIRAQGIDIVIDVALHMAGGRLPALARKPAPVHVSFAYFATCGLAEMDYRLTDHTLDPPGETEAFNVETLVRLRSFWCYPADQPTPPVNDLPALQHEHITFGSLNNPCKLSPTTIALWSRLLQALPDARLMLLVSDTQGRADHLLSQFASRGIEADRLMLIGRRSHDEYLKLYHNIDIALDPLPYNGHSTACDGLWMGVPLLTLPGATSVGRAGASFLTNLEMNEWIATSPEDLIDRAKGFAADLNRTAEIRRTLRARMRQSIICDGANYTRDLEQQLRWMWRRWCGSSSNG